MQEKTRKLGTWLGNNETKMMLTYSHRRAILSLSLVQNVRDVGLHCEGEVRQAQYNVHTPSCQLPKWQLQNTINKESLLVSCKN